MFEDMIIKYGWSAIGLLISSIPVFYPEYAGSDTKAREAQIDAQAKLASVASPGQVTVDKKT